MTGSAADNPLSLRISGPVRGKETCLRVLFRL